jgi:hypothetical protein
LHRLSNPLAFRSSQAYSTTSPSKTVNPNRYDRLHLKTRIPLTHWVVASSRRQTNVCTRGPFQGWSVNSSPGARCRTHFFSSRLPIQ